MTLREFLDAPPRIQEAFEREAKRKIERSLGVQRWVEADLADDPVARVVKLGRDLDDDHGVSIIDLRWDDDWRRRADRAQRVVADGALYDRDDDPLMAIDLREMWEVLTGEAPNRAHRVRCPNPDHEDRWPACSIREDYFRCFACQAAGSIIDLGALLYGEEPRGAGFFRIRERLLADLGMDERSVA